MGNVLVATTVYWIIISMPSRRQTTNMNTSEWAPFKQRCMVQGIPDDFQYVVRDENHFRTNKLRIDEVRVRN